MRGWKSWKLLFISSIIAIANCDVSAEVREDVAKLPHCLDEEDVGYVLVSTLDGKLSALRANGDFAWEVDTGNGPLLHSSIHDVELNNQGELIRIIPSLSGSLYKFNGKTIDAIPVNADTLLKSSFVYSSDTVIAGRRDVRTYGVVARTGKLLYECSSDGCHNITQTVEDFDDIIVIERSTAIVRAHEPRTGQERWNFSVGYHNIKIPPASCINLDSAITSLNITAALPDGVITATRKATHEHLWQHVFAAPIVKIWKWDGRDLYAVDVFAHNAGRGFGVAGMDQKYALTLSPAIYLGMHKQQLYIHESMYMMQALQKYGGNSQGSGIGATDVGDKALTSFPWKPVPAGQLQDEVDDATAISVLYSSNYVDGNGYYFYTEADRKKTLACENIRNETSKFFNRFESSSVFKSVFVTIGFIVVTALITQFKTIYNFLMPQTEVVEVIIRKGSTKSSQFETATTDVSVVSSNTTASSVYNDAPLPAPPPSHFMDNFDIISKLGKGGYGIVFEVKQKIDNSHYAVKIIPLPQKPVAKERVLREVVALARLDHPNIVRYSTSWHESSLPDFKTNTPHLSNAFSDTSFFSSEIYEEETEDLNDEEDEKSVDVFKHHRQEDKDDFLIVFDSGTGDASAEDTESHSNSTRITVNTQTSSDSVVFERPPRVLHNSISIEDTDGSTSESSKYLVKSESRQRKTSNRDGDVDRRYLFIQMQLCDKMTLKDWMRENVHRLREDVYAYYMQILGAVAYIHEMELIHRDLKPSNIFFNAKCNPAQIKVGDFGLVTPMQNTEGCKDGSARGVALGHTRDTGTALYMSPEQKNGSHYNYKVDVFSLGVILFELLVYFSTEGERIVVLTDLRRGQFPQDFQNENPKEYTLLKTMLASNAKERPTVSEVMQQIVAINAT